jgi:predicted metal-dependent hydrolase
MKLSFWKQSEAKKRILSPQSILIGERTIPYTLLESARAKHIRITIYREGKVCVIVPKKVNLETVNKLVTEKSMWILSKVDYYKMLPPSPLHTDTQQEYLEHKDKILHVVQEAVKKYNAFYDFTYKDIRIKNQKTLWGSCARSGNLNFNYKIGLLRECLRDYVVVHELCHLKEFNHSSKFWNLVARTIPNHKELRKELKSEGLRLR